MIPPCRNCAGIGKTDGAAGDDGTCTRCEGSQLDEAWVFTVTPTRPGYCRLKIAYGAHAATRPVADEEWHDEVVDVLLDALGGRIRRGLIIRDKR